MSSEFAFASHPAMFIIFSLWHTTGSDFGFYFDFRPLLFRDLWNQSYKKKGKKSRRTALRLVVYDGDSNPIKSGSVFFFMRLCAALDLIGLQAVRQGQMTNNWLKHGPPIIDWGKIKDKQLFLRLPRHHSTPGLRQTAETLLYLWWSMGETPGPLLEDLLSFLCLCSITAFQRRHWIFLFFFWVSARQQFLSKRDSHPLTLTKGQCGFVSISMSSRQKGSHQPPMALSLYKTRCIID